MMVSTQGGMAIAPPALVDPAVNHRARIGFGQHAKIP
jgi:hypothetical protein